MHILSSQEVVRIRGPRRAVLAPSAIVRQRSVRRVNEAASNALLDLLLLRKVP